MQQTYSLKLNNIQKKNLYTHIIDNNWERLIDNNPYIEYKYKQDTCIVTLYTSSKIVIQGTGIAYNGVINAISIQHSSSHEYIAHIGADEVGKGDYFGPLVVCSCYISEENYDKVLSLGIMDSKKITDTNIRKIYNNVKDSVIYSVKVLEPSEYNIMYEMYNNIATMLSSLHYDNTCKLIDRLIEEGREYNKIVIDQFSSRKDRLESVFKGYKLEQFHKAESLDSVVACASVIARYYFIEYMNNMNLKHNFEFPLGSTHVIDSGVQFAKENGIEGLRNVAKISFKTTSEIIARL